MKQLSKSLILSTQGLILVLCLPYLLQAQQKAKLGNGTLTISNNAKIQYGNLSMGLGNSSRSRVVRSMLGKGGDQIEINESTYVSYSNNGEYYAEKSDLTRSEMQVEFYRAGSQQSIHSRRTKPGEAKVASDGKHFMIINRIYSEISFYTTNQKKPLQTVGGSGLNQVELSKNGNRAALAIDGLDIGDKVILYDINGNQIFSKKFPEDRYRLKNIDISPKGRFLIANVKDYDLTEKVKVTNKKTGDSSVLGAIAGKPKTSTDRILLLDQNGTILTQDNKILKGVGKFHYDNDDKILIKTLTSFKMYNSNLELIEEYAFDSTNDIIRYEWVEKNTLLLLRSVRREKNATGIKTTFELIRIKNGNRTKQIITYQGYFKRLHIGYRKVGNEIFVIMNDNLAILK